MPQKTQRQTPSMSPHESLLEMKQRRNKIRDIRWQFQRLSK